MKLKKINLSELANAEIKEREMSQLLGGGTPGCCQCGCNYATSGGSSTSANDSANSAKGYTSDPGAQPCCPDPEVTRDPSPKEIVCARLDKLCGNRTDPMC